jgi:hypothetical protein
MTLVLRLLAILGLFALSTIPFAMAGDDGDGDEAVVVEGDNGGDGPEGPGSDSEED